MNQRETVARALARVEYDSDEDFEIAVDSGHAPSREWYRYVDAVLAALGLGEGGENVVVPRGFGACPFDQRNDPRQRGLKPTDPCPVCGGLGTDDAEDKCVAYAATRRAMLSARPQAGEAGE